MRASDGATARLADCWFDRASEHAVVVTTGAQPTIRNCLLEAAGASTVLVTDHGRGALRDCTIRRRQDAPTIEITRGGSPSIYGGTPSRDLASDGSLVSRLVPRRARSADVADDWFVHVHHEGAGDLRQCTIGEVHTATGGNPVVNECTVDRFRADAGGRGQVRRIRPWVWWSWRRLPTRSSPTAPRSSRRRAPRSPSTPATALRAASRTARSWARRCATGRPTRPSGSRAGPPPPCAGARSPTPGEGAVWAETEADGLLDGCDVRSERGPGRGGHRSRAGSR